MDPTVPDSDPDPQHWVLVIKHLEHASGTAKKRCLESVNVEKHA
jgi:hypothetical protein